MNKKLMVLGVVFCLLISANANASSRVENSAYKSSQLELSPLLINNGAAKTVATTSAVSKNYNSTSSTKSAITTKKDLQIEGRVEKTQNTSLYQNQSKAELQDLVQNIGYNILKANSIQRSVQFVYDEEETVNANVNINNRVRVYKGLIKRCDSEDELAYVIGHELGHATSSHVAKGIATDYAGNVAQRAAVAGLSTVVPSGILMTATSFAVSQGVDLSKKKVSRICENNADLLSIDYIIKAGYNPLAAISISYKIGENYPDFWFDHTSTDRRIVLMYNYIQEKYPRYIEKGYDSDAYNNAVRNYVGLYNQNVR